MSGLIVGLYGFQRSGKTLLAFLLAEGYFKRGIPVYTNMDVPGYTHIESISELPLSYEPKVLLLDEAYFFLDSRMWQDNTAASIFFNTIGKQNILLILTAIEPGMIEGRLRRQHNYLFLVKADKNLIYYKCFNVVKREFKVFTLIKNESLFSQCRYNTKQVPDFVDFQLTDFAERIKEWNGKNRLKNNNIKNKRSVVL